MPFLIPQNGLLVPNDQNDFKPFAPEGESVSEITPFLKRRMKEGALKEGKQKKTKG